MIRCVNNPCISTRPRRFPKGLIYNPSGTDSYRLVDIKNKKIVGEMYAFSFNDIFLVIELTILNVIVSSNNPIINLNPVVIHH